MSEELQTAISLLGIGMTTVFTVLLLVTIVGNVLIRVINRMAPEDVGPPQSGLPAKTMAVLVAAVESVTQGKGKIEKIEKH